MWNVEKDQYDAVAYQVARNRFAKFETTWRKISRAKGLEGWGEEEKNAD